MEVVYALRTAPSPTRPPNQDGTLTSANTFVAYAAAFSGSSSERETRIGVFALVPRTNWGGYASSRLQYAHSIMGTVRQHTSICAPFAELQSPIETSPLMKVSAIFSTKESKRKDETLDPCISVRLYNMSWNFAECSTYHCVLHVLLCPPASPPPALISGETNVHCPTCVVYGREDDETGRALVDYLNKFVQRGKV